MGIEPVSVNPRTNDEVWVVNQEYDSISVVSVPKGIVTDRIRVKDEPMDASDPRWFRIIRYTMPDNDVAIIDTVALAVSGYYSGVGTINLGIAVLQPPVASSWQTPMAAILCFSSRI